MIEYIITALLSLAVGLGIGRYLLQQLFSQTEKNNQEKAEILLEKAKSDAESLKKDKIIEADEYFRKLKENHDRDAEKKTSHLERREDKVKKLEQRIQQDRSRAKELEANLNRDRKDLKRSQEQIKQQEECIQEVQARAEKALKEAEERFAEAEHKHSQQVAALEKISGLKAEDAKAQLVEAITAEAQTEASAKMRQLIEEAKLSATKEARRIVLTTIQRTATEHAVENCVSVFPLENDEVKGKIIGREGRNIRALEAATGVEIIVDDTPEAITISGFDPVRREVARLSLHKLVTDGRIHPARIEEVVAKTQSELDEEVIEHGERTVIELGIHGLAPELIRLVGKMRFRSSYGQNLLQHSKEVAKMCATMASELGFDVKKAKRAGLLHDIGKVYTEDPEKPHALAGMELAERYGEHPEVCNAIGAHHDEIEMTSPLSPIIQACDAISGARPGARRETMESYIKRLQDLESLGRSHKGVSKCYAIQAGRELRVIVDAESITDNAARDISFNIAQQIEKEMQYPGQIKVTVIREKRAVQFAK